MKKLKLFALATVAFLGFSGAANAETVLLASDDFVGISFWIIAMGMAAATVFFFMERGTVHPGWKTSVTVAGLVTGVAFVHYMYMREVWVMTGDSPTVYRYIDWLITVPLQMIEFYLILAAVRKIPGFFLLLLELSKILSSVMVQLLTSQYICTQLVSLQSLPILLSCTCNARMLHQLLVQLQLLTFSSQDALFLFP